MGSVTTIPVVIDGEVVQINPRWFQPVATFHPLAEVGERMARLAPQQLACLQLRARGYNSHQIGDILDISYLTVKNHLAVTYRKLELDADEPGFLACYLLGGVEQRGIVSRKG